MTKEELEKLLAEIKPTMPLIQSLELVSLEGNEIKLKVTGLPQDEFKVQGKVVKLDDEFKNKITGRIESSFKGAQVSFI
ncbi:MAG: hypothetical protein PHQ46_12915 [Negativicutes bacterium]|nr:hypothetical protein [Negativicutes bacterium]